MNECMAMNDYERLTDLLAGWLAGRLAERVKLACWIKNLRTIMEPKCVILF